MGAGRPSLYSPELLEKAREYVDNPPQADRTESGTFKDGEVLHSVVGLALHLGISRETVYDWSSHDDKPEFSDIVKRVNQLQEQALVSHGLAGTYNPTIAKLLLGKHGYSDKVESTNSHTIDLSSASDDDLKRIINGE